MFASASFEFTDQCEMIVWTILQIPFCKVQANSPNKE